MKHDASRVILRPLHEDDITSRYLAWFRDKEVIRFLDSSNISRQDAIDHFMAGQTTGTYTVYAIVDRQSGTHVGNIKLGPIAHKHGYSDCITVIGDRDYWGRGLASDAIRCAIRIGFDELGLRKFSAGIVEDNEASLRAYISAGFVVEARLKGQFLVDGEARDRIGIACFNPAFFSNEGS